MVTVVQARNNALMLARSIQTIVFTTLVFLVCWLIYTEAQSPWLTIAAVIVVFALLPMNLVRTFWLSARSAQHQPLFTGGLGAQAVQTVPHVFQSPKQKAWFLAWSSEVKTATQTFLWRQAFASQSVPDYVCDCFGSKGRRGVVFIHGFICNRGLWNPWMKRLRQQNTAFTAVSLEPVFASIDDYATQIEDAVTRVTACTGLAPLLVCHSMGGLAARAWLRKLSKSGIETPENRVHHIVTIGTPHFGTLLGAKTYPPNAAQMALNSDWLAQLAQDESAMSPARNKLFTCFYSNCDNIVFPTATASLPEADNRLVEAAGHLAMAFNPVVLDVCMAKL